MERPACLLLADAKSTNYAKIRRILEQLPTPCDILEAPHQLAAMAVLSGNTPLHLVLSDGQPPQLTCFDARELVQKYRPTVPFLVVCPDTLQGTAGRPCRQLAQSCTLQCDLQHLPTTASFLLETALRSEAAIAKTEDARTLLEPDGQLLGYRGAGRDTTSEVGQEGTLLALSKASLAVQQARTPEEVYHAVVEEMNLLGYRTVILNLSFDEGDLQVEPPAISCELLERFERLTGLSVDKHRIPIDRLPHSKQLLEDQDPVFLRDLIPILNHVLPASAILGSEHMANTLELHQGILAPLIMGGQASGLILVSADTLTEADMPAVMTFADQISAALERARLFAELQEREWRASLACDTAQHYAQDLEETIRGEQARLREISALHLVAAVTAEELAPEVVMERGLTVIVDLYQLETATLYLMDEEKRIHPTFAIGTSETLLAKMRANPPSLPDLPLGSAILAGQPALSENLEDIEKPEQIWLHDSKTRTAVSLPLRVGGRLVGLAVLGALRPRAITTDDLPLLISIATQFATALENARLFKQEQQRRAELDRLNQALRLFANQLQECHDQAAIAQLLCEAVQDALGWKRSVVSLRDDESMTYRPVAHRGYPPEATHLQIPWLIAPLDNPPWMREQFQISHSYYVPDLAALEEDKNRRREDSEDAGHRALLAIPLEAGGRILGILFPIDRKDQQHPARQQIEYLELFAAQAAIAIESIQLSQSVRMWADAVQHSGDAIAITDAQGRVLSVNPAFETLTGYHEAEVAGQDSRILMSNLSQPNAYEKMWSTIRAGAIWRGEVINRRKDGSEYDADLTIAPIRGVDDELIGFIGSQRDISQLKELDRLKSQFVSSVSHELRTPLTNIKLYQRYLREGRRPEMRDRLFDILDQETNRLVQIIEDLLDLSGLDAVAKPLRAEPLDIQELVGQIVTGHEPRAEEHGVALRFEPTDRSLLVLADRMQITRAITHLVSNAVHYSLAGGSVHVATRLAGSSVQISVSDTGYGITQEELRHIFDRFFRGEAAHKSGAAGTGLGLAIVQQILDQHGGTIAVESEVNKGTTFTVTLPAPQPIAAHGTELTGNSRE